MAVPVLPRRGRAGRPRRLRRGGRRARARRPRTCACSGSTGRAEAARPAVGRSEAPRAAAARGNPGAGSGVQRDVPEVTIMKRIIVFWGCWRSAASTAGAQEAVQAQLAKRLGLTDQQAERFVAIYADTADRTREGPRRDQRAEGPAREAAAGRGRERARGGAHPPPGHGGRGPGADDPDPSRARRPEADRRPSVAAAARAGPTAHGAEGARGRPRTRRPATAAAATELDARERALLQELADLLGE